MLAIYAAFLQLPYTTSDAAITRTIPEEDLPDQEMGRSVAPRRSSRDKGRAFRNDLQLLQSFGRLFFLNDL